MAMYQGSIRMVSMTSKLIITSPRCGMSTGTLPTTTLTCQQLKKRASLQHRIYDLWLSNKMEQTSHGTSWYQALKFHGASGPHPAAEIPRPFLSWAATVAPGESVLVVDTEGC